MEVSTTFRKTQLLYYIVGYSLHPLHAVYLNDTLIPSYTILYHLIPSYTVLYHLIPSYTILYHLIPFLYHLIPSYYHLYTILDPNYVLVQSPYLIGKPPFSERPLLGIAKLVFMYPLHRGNIQSNPIGLAIIGYNWLGYYIPQLSISYTYVPLNPIKFDVSRINFPMFSLLNPQLFPPVFGSFMAPGGSTYQCREGLWVSWILSWTQAKKCGFFKAPKPLFFLAKMLKNWMFTRMLWDLNYRTLGFTGGLMNTHRIHVWYIC